MPKRTAQDFTFLTDQTDGGDARCNILRRNRLSDDH
jgi:hypothetical protein